MVDWFRVSHTLVCVIHLIIFIIFTTKLKEKIINNKKYKYLCVGISSIIILQLGLIFPRNIIKILFLIPLLLLVMLSVVYDKKSFPRMGIVLSSISLLITNATVHIRQDNTERLILNWIDDEHTELRDIPTRQSEIVNRYRNDLLRSDSSSSSSSSDALAGYTLSQASATRALQLIRRLTQQYGRAPQNRTILNQLPTYKFDANTQEKAQCRVCLCDYENDEEIKILPCLHKYHKECIDEWLKDKTECPVCRHDATVVV